MPVLDFLGSLFSSIRFGRLTSMLEPRSAAKGLLHCDSCFAFNHCFLQPYTSQFVFPWFRCQGVAGMVSGSSTTRCPVGQDLSSGTMDAT